MVSGASDAELRTAKSVAQDVSAVTAVAATCPQQFFRATTIRLWSSKGRMRTEKPDWGVCAGFRRDASGRVQTVVPPVLEQVSAQGAARAQILYNRLCSDRD